MKPHLWHNQHLPGSLQAISDSWQELSSWGNYTKCVFKKSFSGRRMRTPWGECHTCFQCRTMGVQRSKDCDNLVPNARD